MAITYFLGSVGALMGPLLGIVLTDYYLLRKGAVVQEDLYSHSRTGTYAYGNGWNGVAVKALAPGAVIAILLAVLPQLASVSFLSWFAGTAVSSLLYYRLSDRVPAPVDAPVTRDEATAASG